MVYHRRSRLLPPHRMENPHWKNGRCNKLIKETGAVCGQVYAHPCHRIYPCEGAVKDYIFTECEMEFTSIESRDRHQANEHGTGW